jgi:type II secretory ATPase GspE/PulE/Tfp pilus assembly ATPase PilB-like protein
MILAGAHEHALREHLQRFGNVKLLQDAMLKLRAGITTLAEVKRASTGAFNTRRYRSSPFNLPVNH